MSTSPALNQFLQDCANADIAPTVAAAELRNTTSTRLSFWGKGDEYDSLGYVAVNWGYNRFLGQYFRSTSVYSGKAWVTVYNRKGQVVRT